MKMWYVKKYKNKIIFYLNHRRVIVVPFGREPLWAVGLKTGFYKSRDLVEVFKKALTKYTRNREKSKIIKYLNVINDYYWGGEI